VRPLHECLHSRLSGVLLHFCRDVRLHGDYPARPLQVEAWTYRKSAAHSPRGPCLARCTQLVKQRRACE
jgi:hypothetical protein